MQMQDSTNGSVWALNNVDDDVPRNGMSQNGPVAAQVWVAWSQGPGKVG